jgi:hypothetical protein
MADLLISAVPGTRSTLCGRTGSGKSTLAAYMLRKSTQQWLCVDPKRDDKLARLPGAARTESLRAGDIAKLWARGVRYVLLTPPPASSPDDMDSLILALYESHTDWGLMVDELYYLHRNSRAGAGLMAVLTRGRSDKITFLGCTQRPAWISQFCLSEADYIAQYRLSLADDRKRVYQITGDAAVLSNPPGQHEFYWYEAKKNLLTIVKPA